MGFLDNVKDALKDAISSQSSKDAEAKKDAEANKDVVVDHVADTATADAEAEAEAEAEAVEPTVAPDAREARFETYTVKTGDSLSEIGARFGVPSQEIATLNNIENPDLIFPGQVFRIPKN